MSGLAELLKKQWHWYLLAILIVVSDQWTKSLASHYLDYGRPQEILPFFDLRLVWNQGAAFSFLSDAGGWQRWFFLGISLLASLLIAFWWLPTQTRIWSLAGMALVLGGAVGNLIDRAMLGYVIDFVSLHWQGRYFPAFNIADSAITLGAITLGIDWIILEPRDSGSENRTTGVDDNGHD